MQNDRNVRCVEELDGIAAVLSTVACGLDREIDAEALEVYDYSKDEDGGQEVHQVGEVLTVEGLAQAANLVLTCCEQVEKSDNGTFEFGSAAGVDSCRRERLPYDGFANVGGNEQRDTRSETISYKKST